MTRREKQWRRILSTSLLDATVPSDEVSSNSDCEKRTVVRRLVGNNDMPVLGLAGCHWREWKLVQVHGGDQSPLPPLWNSFVGTGIHNGPVPPAWKRKSWTITKPLKYRREVLHLYRWSTQTIALIEIVPKNPHHPPSPRSSGASISLPP